MSTETQTLELAPEQPGEAPMRQLAPFDAQRIEAEKLKRTAETLVVTSITDKAGMALARTTRLALKAVRVSIEHRRVELVEDALRQKQAIDADAKKLKESIEELEAKMLEQEQFAERKAEEELRLKVQRRTTELAVFWNSTLPMPDLGALTVDQFDTLLADAESAHTMRLERARIEREEAEARAVKDSLRQSRAIELAPISRFITVKLTDLGEMTAEAYALLFSDAKAAEQAEQAEQERRRVENERLKKEAEVREAAAKKEREAAAAKLKAEQERAAKERAAIEDKARQEMIAAQKAREEEQRKFEAEAKKQRAEAAERERVIRDRAIEAQRIADENARAQAAKAKAEREAREKAERELKAQRDAEEAKRKAEADAAKKAARAPDKQKLLSLAQFVSELEAPAFTSAEGKALIPEINERINNLCEWLEAQAKGL